MNSSMLYNTSLQKNMLADQLAYWKKQLENAPATLVLPTDRPRPAIRTNQGAVESFVFSKRLADTLKAISQQEGTTLYMTLVAAFQTLLHRYAGQDDVLIGSYFAERTLTATENSIGSFCNTVALRTDLSGNPSFRELLKRVRRVILEAQAHQDIPFEYLVKELQFEQNTAQNSLFQIMLVFEPQAPALPSGQALTPMDFKSRSVQYDLSLVLADRPEGLIGRFEYSTDLFDAATIHRMVGHWQTLLEGIGADSGQRIGELPVLTEPERHQILVEWNPTPTAIEHAKGKCIHQIFEAQVERNPDAVAVVCEDKSLTYRELNSKANQLAHFLQQEGVGPEVPVSMYVERSLVMIVGLLGILKAGGTYVPLDPTYPAERLAFMLADNGSSVLLTQQQLVVKLPNYKGRVICLDSEWEKIGRESEANPESAVTAQSLAYMIYTSGSTGKPKGVMTSHGSVVCLFEAVQDWFHFNSSDVWSLFHSYTFDFSVWELWGALLHGGRLVIIPYWVSRSPEAFYDLLLTEQVTVLSQCPLAFQQLIQVEKRAVSDRVLALRLVIFGCEAFDRQRLKPWYDRQGDRVPRLVVMYGPTETTVFVTYYPLSEMDMEYPSRSIIGKPIPGSQIYLLDRYQQPVPIGVPGEVYIGGTGLARGYLNRPELTAERFIPHPFSQHPEARLYKSGDLARYLPDGSIEFLERIDHQLKIRGYRIEPGEIEAVLSQYPAVRQAVVVPREDTSGDKRLVAYIVADKEHPPTVKDLRDYLRERLPEHMVPSFFVLLDAVPLTSNSKFDRRALPAPQWSEQVNEQTYVPPTLTAHHQLIQVWEGLLEARPIGITDNFFDLGGNSLLAARMVDQFERVSGKKIPLATLFAGPTIEQLVDALQQQETTFSSYPLVTVQANGTRKPFFFLHGDWTRGAFYCFTLASALGNDQPFYALEPYRADGLQIPMTLQEMAAAHLASLRVVQPDGPYLLGGFCNGALLAYEMARQLHAEGQKVDLLVLINPMLHPYQRLLRAVIHHLGKTIGFSQNRQTSAFLRLRHALRHLYRFLRPSNDARLQDFEQLLQADPRLDGMFPPIEALRKDYVGVFIWLAAGYTLEQYPGKIAFFWANEELAMSEKWGKVAEATESEVHIIPGTLITCLTEHAQVLASHLSVCLSKAQAALLGE